MKKILFFIDTLGHGGAEKVLVNLVNNLDKQKYDITVMTIFDGGVNKQFLNNKIKYRYIFRKVFRGNVALFKSFNPKYLYKHYIKEHYDIVIAYLEGNTTRILSGCPYTDTKKFAWIHVEMDIKTRIYPYRNAEECKKCYEKFDKIVCVSKNVKESFESQMGKWDNIEVKYNTNETEQIKNNALEKVNDVYLQKDVVNIVSVGRLIEQKSYKRLLRVHNRLINEGIKHNLFILGEGGQRKVLEKFINDNKLEKSVHLLGFKENPWKYVSKCDLFVCSSWKEGFSTAVTEALILGVPVLTTNCSGMVEMLGNSEYGVIVDNNEEALYKGLKELLQNKDKLYYYKEMAKKRGEFFDTAKTVVEIENLIDSI